MDGLVRNFFNLEQLQRSLLVLSEGAVNTIKLGVFALTLALAVGLVVAALNLSPWPKVRWLTEWYIDIMRAMPLLVAMVMAFYLLPPLTGFTVDPFLAAVIAFGLMHGAYFAEVYRGGWLAIDRGQMDAARSLGFRSATAVRLIIVPQVLRIIGPPMTSQMTLLMRDLPLAFIIGYFEILNSAKAAQVFTSNSTPLVAVVVFYAVWLLAFQAIAGRLERRSRRLSET
jgi:His/Glu/Gln/Arg/opine family amino acid ABC transporter permease subunit